MSNPNLKYYNAANSEETVQKSFRMLKETPEYVDFSLARDYVSARSRFQKGYTSFSGDPGYFYFRILIDHRGSPLLATPDSKSSQSRVSAARFLINNRKRAQCTARLQALQKFQKLLYYLEKETPWVFRKVADINKGLYTDLSKPGDGDRMFTIECSEEFTDFRLSLLMDLYRFACFDYQNQRVIVPENLRRFNVTVLFFTIPLRWIDTPISPQLSAVADIVGTFTGNSSKPLPYKGIRQNDSSAPISAYMIHFRDCEFLDKSMVSLFGAGDNAQPQQFSPRFQIRYRRAYAESVSEWFNMNVSEMNQYYFDSDTATFDAGTVNGVSQETGKTKVQQSLVNAVKSELASVKDTFSSISAMFKGTGAADEAERWKLIREQKLWGGKTLGNQLAGMVESTIDNVIGGLGDFVTLGNIYDESWIANLKGFASADSAFSAAESLVKSGMSFAAKATGNGFLASVAQNGIVGGISDAVNTASKSAASFLTGKGMSDDFYSMFSKWSLEHDRKLNAGDYSIPSVLYAASAAGTAIAPYLESNTTLPPAVPDVIGGDTSNIYNAGSTSSPTSPAPDLIGSSGNIYGTSTSTSPAQMKNNATTL